MTRPGLHPVSGEGVLARAGSLVLLCSTDDEASVDGLLAALDKAASAEDGTALADGVTAALDGTSGVGAVAFGPVGRSVLVAVFGHAWADVATEYGEQRLALRGSGDGVRIVLPGTLLSIKAGLGHVADLVHQQWGNLEHGSVHAGGLVYVPAPEAAAPAVEAGQPAVEPEPEPEPEPVPEPVLEPEPLAAGAVVEEPAEESAEEPDAVPPQPETEVSPVPAPVGLSKPEEPLAAPVPAPEPPPPAPAPELPPVQPAPDLMAAMVAEPAQPQPQPEPQPAEPPQNDLLMPPPVAPAMPTVSPPSIPDVDRSQPFASVSLLASAAPPVETRAPLPVATPMPEPAPEAAPPPHPVEDHGVQVLGVYCKNGHFDDPSARYCAVCGISMAQLTLAPKLGPRPPLGVLVLDDGSIFSLQTDYVVGRDPSRDERVLAGSARPLRLDDPKGLISRAHCLIHLEGWQVQVVDLASANGTGVYGPGDAAWQVAPRMSAVTIRPGTQVGFGQRQLRFESHTNT